MNLNMIPEEQPAQVFERQAAFIKLFTHPARLAILSVLRQDEACVCHLEAVLGMRQAYISQQLAVLREAGLIQDRREGWNVFYRVADPEIFEILDAAARVLGSGADDGHLTAVDKCPCPKCNAGSH
jgi:ArsR family transcriptional regulator